jgi:hypothetical protein
MERLKFSPEGEKIEEKKKQEAPTTLATSFVTER